MGVAWAGQMFCWDPSSLSPRAKTTAKDARRARMFGRAEHPCDDCGDLRLWRIFGPMEGSGESEHRAEPAVRHV